MGLQRASNAPAKSQQQIDEEFSSFCCPCLVSTAAIATLIAYLITSYWSCNFMWTAVARGPANVPLVWNSQGCIVDAEWTDHTGKKQANTALLKYGLTCVDAFNAYYKRVQQFHELFDTQGNASVPDAALAQQSPSSSKTRLPMFVQGCYNARRPHKFYPGMKDDFDLYVTPLRVVSRLGIASLCLLVCAILGCWCHSIRMQTPQGQARTASETVPLAKPVKESSKQASFDVENAPNSTGQGKRA